MYRNHARMRMAEADLETLSLLGQGVLGLGMQPDNAWLQDFVRETHFKMDEVCAGEGAAGMRCMAGSRETGQIESIWGRRGRWAHGRGRG